MHTPFHWYPAPEAALPAALLGAALAPLGWLYAGAGSLKRGLARPYKAAVPVICIGNLTAGGTGKTPLTMFLARSLATRGYTPHILTRGYGGSIATPTRADPARHTAADIGDEALLLARAAPVWVSPDRAASARLAVAAGADMLLMDDGFQNAGLAQDTALLVVDGAAGFGNGRLIPAGPLREPVDAGFARAAAIVINGEATPRTLRQIAAWHGATFRMDLAPVQQALPEAAYIAFAGIGQPERFFASLRQAGARLAETHPFPDHHVYAASEIEVLKARAKAAAARLITTEKDATRLGPETMRGIEAFAVAARIERAAELLDCIESRLRARLGAADGGAS